MLFRQTWDLSLSTVFEACFYFQPVFGLSAMIVCSDSYGFFSCLAIKTAT